MTFQQAKHTIFYLTALALLHATFTPLHAQSRKEVTRSTAISDDLPILNVTLNEDGSAWVGNKDELYQAFDMSLVTPLPLGPDEISVAQLPDGNDDIRLSRQALVRLAGESAGWSCAFYEERKDVLYLGTRDQGLFVLKTEPNLRVVEHLTSGSSRLKSNAIRSILKGRDGRMWIGTEKGVLVGADGKWKLMESDLNIDGVSQNATETWVLAYDELFFVDEKDDWYVYELPRGSTEGALKDISWDTRGNLWILSQVITEYSVEQEQSVIYGPADYFTSEYASRIRAGGDGRVWVGTSDKGVYLLDKASLLAVDLQIDQPLGCEENEKVASLKVRISGGTPPYTLDWENGLQGENPSGLGAGTYSVTVTDESGKAKVAEITIAANPLEIRTERIAPESALGANDGKAKVSISGGEEPYTVEWENGETTLVAEALSEGEWAVVVTDARGCSQRAVVVMNAIVEALEASLTETASIRCYGEMSGALEAKVRGGKPPYSYAWSATGPSGSTASSLSAGSYTVTVSDASGLTRVAEALLVSPTALQVQATQQSPASTNGRDGRAVAEASGGSGRYSYAWDDGSTKAAADALTPDTHRVTVTDENGCTAEAEVVISEDILPLEASLTETGTIRCFGEKTGALEAKVRGGKPPYSYAWSATGPSGSTASDLSPGSYTVTVSDASGLTRVAEALLVSPTALQVQATQQSPASTNGRDGQAVAEASGGSGRYSYAWDDGSTKAAADALTPGAHRVTVTDENGCTAEAEVVISEDILPLEASLTETASIRCFGEKTGALEAKVRGGKPPYSYAWSATGPSGSTAADLSPGSYTVTVSDASGLTRVAEALLVSPTALQVQATQQSPASTNGRDGQAVAEVSGGSGRYSYAWDDGSTKAAADALTPGVHRVTVTDENGCTAEAEVVISEDILPLGVTLELAKPVSCAGQSDAELSVKLEGGKSPFSIQWSSGQNDSKSVSGLGAGSYAVTVSDASGQSLERTLTITQPDPLSVEIENVKRTRLEDTQDGRGTATAKGGTLPYKFLWSNGESDAQAESLPMGTQSVTVTDKNGCQATASAEVKKRIIPELTAGMLSEGQTIRIQQLQFDADSTNINEASKPVLREVSEFLRENPEIVVEIGGHTNGIPEHEYCDWLSTERAKAVADFVVSQGADGRRVYYKGYGKRKPIASNFTEDGRALNQRVEIKVLTLEGD